MHLSYRLSGAKKFPWFSPAFARFMRIILGRKFLSVGMKWAGKNHPWKRIFIRGDEMSGEESSLKEDFVGRDEISREESSLEEDFCWQG